MQTPCRIFLFVAIFTGALNVVGQEPRPDPAPAKQFQSGLGYLLSPTTQNVTDGLRLIRAAADGGYAPAQDAMGAIYYDGQFVTRDVRQAMDWYKKAAAQREGIAATWLGYFSFTGQGVQRDLDAAKKWFSIAAEQGDPIAEYYQGRIAEQKDQAAAPALFKKAAEQGLVQAQLKLASILDAGGGVKRDPVESFTWYLIAADSGSAASRATISKLESEIGSTAAQQARERAVSLREQINRSRNSLGCFDWPGRDQNEPVPPPLTVQQNCRR